MQQVTEFIVVKQFFSPVNILILPSCEHVVSLNKMHTNLTMQQ